MLRDDFFTAPSDSAQGLGELGWTWLGSSGAGVRPTNISGSGIFGVIGPYTGAARRNWVKVTWDTSNIIGGGGMYISGLQNSSTVFHFRVKLQSLKCAAKAGLESYSSSTFKTGRFFGLSYREPETAWTATTSISLNEYTKPVISNGRRYYASVAGTTGATEPVWTTTAAGTVVDGSVIWVENGKEGSVNIQAMYTPNTADEGLSATVIDTGIVASINNWLNIKIRWITGNTWGITINNSSEASFILTSIINSTMVPVFSIESTSVTSAVLNMDYFGLFSRVTRA